MKITEIEAIPCETPFLEPFKVTYGTISSQPHVIVKMKTDEGIVGLGDASPLTFFTGETQQSVLYAIQTILSPLLIGEDPFNVEIIMNKIGSLKGNYSAKAALDMAVHDILGRYLHLPVYRLLGGKFRKRIQVVTGIGIREPEQMADEAVKLVEMGFHTLKMKIGVKPEKDILRVKAIREAVGDDIRIRVDANAGYNLKQAIRVIKAIEKYNPEHVEQPVAAHAIGDMAYLRKATGVPIMADESIAVPLDALRIVQKEAADILAIKFPKCGGIYNAKRIAAIADTAGLPCILVNAFETNIGLAAHLHVAASTRNVSLPCELAIWTLKKDEITKVDTRIEGDIAHVPEKPGLGARLLI